MGAGFSGFGICANVEFAFLGQWLWRQIGRLVPVADVSPFSPPILAWRIHALLGERAFVAAHPRLQQYLRDANGVHHIKERMEASRKGASGWQDIAFFNPVSKKIEPKRIYWERYDNLVFAAGAYKPT